MGGKGYLKMVMSERKLGLARIVHQLLRLPCKGCSIGRLPEKIR
ncbi:hypothetical protein EIKCOROL_00145 [Eikenella corrodens ATCC 23834]|uniref:Uncharacterized protein n=1 Tax=Eikenella corrodens ATCC 23834 TaxID=546274 RepID=C0DS29_EIKCO|nr:hypothetical protein EIKCOROL_00145 [Eikenella corrodens ATCC 23834]